MNEFLLIAGMALVTFGVRYPVLALVGRLQLPEMVLRALKYVPPAVLTAIIVPMITLKDGVFDIRLGNSYLVAGIIAALIAWRTKNLLLTIVLGMAALWGYRLLLGALGIDPLKIWGLLPYNPLYTSQKDGLSKRVTEDEMSALPKSDGF